MLIRWYYKSLEDEFEEQTGVDYAPCLLEGFLLCTLCSIITFLQVEYLKTLAGKADLNDVSNSLASIATNVFNSQRFK